MFSVMLQPHTNTLFIIKKEIENQKMCMCFLKFVMHVCYGCKEVKKNKESDHVTEHPLFIEFHMYIILFPVIYTY